MYKNWSAIYTPSIIYTVSRSCSTRPLLHGSKATQKKKREKEMKVVAAFLLAVLGGNTCPSAEDITTILSSVKGKDITELIAAGREKLASVPAGGGGAVAVAAAGGGAAAAAPAAESRKEEKVEEKEESDDDMGFSLFD